MYWNNLHVIGDEIYKNTRLFEENGISIGRQKWYKDKDSINVSEINEVMYHGYESLVHNF